MRSINIKINSFFKKNPYEGTPTSGKTLRWENTGVPRKTYLFRLLRSSYSLYGVSRIHLEFFSVILNVSRTRLVRQHSQYFLFADVVFAHGNVFFSIIRENKITCDCAKNEIPVNGEERSTGIAWFST